MNKRVVFLSLLIICIFILVIASFKDEKTPEFVLTKMGAKPSNIIHVEYVSNGAFVFVDRDLSGFSCVFVRKNIFGWKYDYDVAQGDLTPFFTKCGLSFSKFPKVRSVPFPLYYGVISDSSIQAVEVRYNMETQVSKATVIENGSNRLWIAPVNNIDEGDVIVTGLSIEREEISRVIETPHDLKFELYNNRTAN
ncbi:MAG: hypothetical protein ACOYVK_04500 [Bacillota bacterium]